MTSYFDNRQARVKLGNTTSGWRKVHRGCPQGSSFGPLMWNLYQNDLTYVLKSNISMYPDDHQFFEANNDVQSIQTKLQESAAVATNWYKENCLQGNFNKYGSMLISKQKDANINIDIDGNKVSYYQNIKLLGVNSIHYGKHSLRYLGPVLWAKLPSRVRTLHSLEGFKRAVRRLDLEMLMDDSGCLCMACNA